MRCYEDVVPSSIIFIRYLNGRSDTNLSSYCVPFRLKTKILEQTEQLLVGLKGERVTISTGGGGGEGRGEIEFELVRFV